MSLTLALNNALSGLNVNKQSLAVLSNKVSAYVTGAAVVVDGGLSLMNWFEPPDLGDL